ncbi:MAG: polysaccharide deacetylase family protein [bacterium JZ-2024 1]
MKRLLWAGALLIILLSSYRLYHLSQVGKSKEVKVLVVYHPEDRKVNDHVLEAYKSVMQEEGIPFQLLSYDLLISFRPDEEFVKRRPAVIFPDAVAQRVTREVRNWVQEFTRVGGGVLVVYDAGTKDRKGTYLKEAIFSNIIGVNYITYDRLKDRSYTHGYFKVKDPNFLGIPTAKLDKERNLVKGYAYGNLLYPMARVEVLDPSHLLLAEVVTKDGQIYPGLIVKPHSKGYVAWVNSPLGFLKAYSDDLPLRATLRAFLFKVMKVPHLANVPGASGGIVINWHIDANVDWKNIPMMIEKGYISEGIPQSFHITAGDFRDSPGDRLGFDACGRGSSFVRMLLPYGLIGSHGGWAHNWFSNGILEKKLDRVLVERFIRENNRCLETSTGYPIIEYSAPNGVHPQPETTRILETLGMNSYYYTGDGGSFPNRTFYDGKKISDNVIAFPVMSYGDKASLAELWREGVQEEDIRKFFLDLLDFVVTERTVRLFYSHPYDIDHYPSAIKEFIARVKHLVAEEKIIARPMSYFADFLIRFMKTNYLFEWQDDRTILVTLKNPEGLKDIAIAVPREVFLLSRKPYRQILDENYRYVVIQDDVQELTLRFAQGTNHEDFARN